MKRTLALRLIALLCLSVCLLTACTGGNGDTETTASPDGGKADYTVSVLDYQGQLPSVDILVEVMKGEESMGMKKAKDGKATFNLDKGNYTFKLSSAEDIYYDSAACTFTAEQTAVTIVIYQTVKETHPIYVRFGKENVEAERYDAPRITEGATYVTLDRTDISYYLFAPNRGGIYRFSCLTEGDIHLGYYGDSNVVLNYVAIEVNNNSFELEFKNGTYTGGGALSIVLGLSSETVKEAVISIERIGDPNKGTQWIYPQAQQLPDAFERSDYLNHRLVNVSLTDPSVSAVFNETDGFYHLGAADGPILYARISSASPYLASFKEICETDSLRKLFVNDDGTKYMECYNEIINAYAAIADNNGVVPLTEELKKVIQNSGEHSKWWDFSSSGNSIFGDSIDGVSSGINEANLVKENAWMFACCYVEPFAVGSTTAPIPLTPSSTLTYRAIVKAGEALCFATSNTAATTLTIENAEGLTVYAGGNTYTADGEGKLSVVLSEAITSFTVACDTEKTISFTFVV